MTLLCIIDIYSYIKVRIDDQELVLDRFVIPITHSEI